MASLPTYIDSNVTAKRDWKVGQKRHQFNLQLIETSLPPRLDNQRPQYFTPAFRKTRAKEFHRFGKRYVEQVAHILRENQKLLTKLVEISTGNKRTDAVRPRSGHSSALRKRRQMEVEAANLSLASRLSTTTSTFSVRKWEESFGQSQRYRRMISKPHPLPRSSGEARRSKSGVTPVTN